MEYPQFNRKYNEIHLQSSSNDPCSIAMLVYWSVLVPSSLRWPSGFVECYWQPPFFFGESCDRRQRAARNFEKDFVGWDGLEFTSRKGLPSKTSQHLGWKQANPLAFCSGFITPCCRESKKIEAFHESKGPPRNLHHGWWAGNPPPHAHFNMLFFSGGSCWCFGIHQWHDMICSIKQKIDTEHVFNVSNFSKICLELFREFLTTHISKLLQSVY